MRTVFSSLLVLCLCLPSALAGTKSYSFNRKDFSMLKVSELRSFYLDRLEAESAYDPTEFRSKFLTCNRAEKGRDLKTTFALCAEHSYLELWAGAGAFNLRSEADGKTRKLSVQSYFFGGRLLFRTSLEQLIIFEGKHFYLPPGKINDQSFEASSYQQGSLALQRRIVATPLSLRLGVGASNVPVPQDVSGGVLAQTAELGRRTVFFAGPLLGLKLTPLRRAGGPLSLGLDMIPVVYKEGSTSSAPARDLQFKFALNWYVHRLWTTTFEAESFKVSTREYGDLSSSSLYLGLKYHLF